jgi:Coenzyme PQQ synthesis protein D (PqqD)
MPGAQLRINAPHIVHETIDGETILIHLGTGAYYSLEGVGAHVWGLAVALGDEGEIVADVQARYDADPQLVAEGVGSLLRKLIEEELLVPAVTTSDGVAEDAPAIGEADEAAPGEEPPRPADSASSLPAEFVAPVLSKYTDMQEFMLIDPIHDVEEEAGWPHVKAG